MNDTLILRFLYNTVLGRMILSLLVRPNFSKLAGVYLSSGASKWLVPYYIQKHNVDMSDIEMSSKGFSSFNDFFTRKRKYEAFKIEDDCLISPCDGLLTIKRIKKDTILDIKNSKYSLEDLLKDKKLAEKFNDGNALIFRLTPKDYHRYCYATQSKIIHIRKIKGKLNCVRPIALRQIPVFAQNSREYQLLKTKKLGNIIQMEIGALLVGKINNYRCVLENDYIPAGEEKGYFEFGGSTIIILLQKDKAYFSKRLYERQDANGEVKVHLGEVIAKSIK